MEHLSIEPTWLGSTYSQEDLLSALAIENAYFKSRYPATFEEAPVLPPTAEQLREDPRYEAVRTYIRQTESSAPRHLVLSNDYPDHGSEYANGFVHRRVQAYRSDGNEVDVVSFKRGRHADVSEYEGVTVLRGYFNELVGLLATRAYESISVHFLNPHMWNALLPYFATTRVYVFVHGYEIRHWIRTPHAHRTPAALRDAVVRTHTLQGFWRHVIDAHPGPARFFFVSHWWRRAAQEDMGLVFPDRRVDIVHNYIDTELFRFVPKPASQRFALLWLRGAHAHNYGADLAAQTLQRLRDSQYWPHLSVRLIGAGRYFQQFIDEFSNEDNVHISETFVDQAQIARIHRDYGVFLVPTRLDSQGVSRDEAMASGLVPVTNAVAAVPEFVDESCAIVAPPEDSDAMARGIMQLLENPSLFESMSRNAAERVRSQSAAPLTVRREAEAMGLRVSGAR